MTEPSERFWTHLLNFIDEGKVIPVVGPELCTVVEGDKEIPLDTWLARRLAQSLAQTMELPLAAPEAPNANYTLNDLVSRYIKNGGERETLYNEVFSILKHANLTPSTALQALASIPKFKLFVSLTFDDLLARALAQVRPNVLPEQLVFLPNKKTDIATTHNTTGPHPPLVFHLLGKLSSSREYALCEDDLLEFVHALQDKQRQPVNLFAEMREHHLLILGCGFSDWLARFFLRSMRSDDFSHKSKHSNYLIGEQIGNEQSLVAYLQHFSADNRVALGSYPKIVPMPAAQFVTELSQRWHKAHPEALAGAKPGDASASAPASLSTSKQPLPEHGAVFISFSSENRSLVTHMAKELTESGVEVWLDSKDLQPGVAWASRIERAIELCSIFLPIISQESINPDQRDRYFWREWNLAHDKALGHAPDLEFIIPVIIDDTQVADLTDTLHKTFTAKQGIILTGGRITPAFAQRLQLLQRDYRRRKGQAA